MHKLLNNRLTQFALVCATVGNVGLAHAQNATTMHRSDEMGQTMMRSMEEMKQMKMTGDTDKDFATMMKMHHQSGVDMAKIEVKNGKDPEMKKMAQKIIDSQQEEIKQFETWLKSRK